MRKIIVLCFIMCALFSCSVFAADKIERQTITTEYISIDIIERQIDSLNIQKDKIETKIKELTRQQKQAKAEGKIIISVDKSNCST